MSLDERKKKILSSVVEDYIESAEPVGSKTIVDKYNLEYSPATIRNEMKLLEDDGYLEQPHISAGRIPSTKGYRYYVDNLMKEKKLSMLDINYIDNSITGYGDTENLLEQASDTVSKLLGRPTILTLKNEDIIESIKLLRITDKILLVIVMSKNGTIKDCVAKLTDIIPEDTVNELTKVLNINLKGTPLERVYYALNMVISKELTTFSEILGQISEGLRRELNSGVKKISNNVESILELPEFSDVEKAKNFVNILSTKDILDSTLAKVSNNELGIIIGSENKEILLSEYSIISLNILDDKNIGNLSVISPKRIDYSKTVSTLKYINSKFKNLFSKPN
ncbi:MAG: heat-inducible transcriptional repressor HrcA [Clostridia bacterium]|nr:heat-inducible transcriptional repressor HrcA [Clostridia bacterium]